MTTWLMDTALFKTLGSSKSTGLRQWLEANDASIFLSAAVVGRDQRIHREDIDAPATSS